MGDVYLAPNYFFLGAVAAFFAGAFFTAGLAAFLATVLGAGAFTTAFFAGAFLAAGLAAFAAGFFAAAIHLTSLPGTLVFRDVSGRSSFEVLAHLAVIYQKVNGSF